MLSVVLANVSLQMLPDITCQHCHCEHVCLLLLAFILKYSLTEQLVWLGLLVLLLAYLLHMCSLILAPAMNFVDFIIIYLFI